MNLTEALAELAARGFDYLGSSRMTLMLNDAKNSFEDTWPFPWLEQTITGPAPLNVPRLKYVRYVQDTDRDIELLGVDVQLIAQDGDPVDMPGVPHYWWADGPHDPDDTVTLNVWPVNTAALSARVIAESPELALPTDTPLIPTRYHSIWIDLAVIQGYQDSDNFNAAAALQGDVSQRLLAVIERYETRNRQNNGYVTLRGPAAGDA